MVYLKCRDVVDKISEIIDGQASMMTRMRFHSHLMMCNNCRRYFKQFKRVKEISGKVTADDLRADFDHVMGFVMKEIDKKDV
ncbi:MAG: zf-HC2 domain-containing protein [Emcibacter sp.]|nr:zf-HC2 domain-containing protein [Emcibacter sp.]